jgi:hypothetical protein
MMENNVQTIIETLAAGQQECQTLLDHMSERTFHVDEMAIMISDDHTLLDFISFAVHLPEVTLFNCCQDTVFTQPIASDYQVRYWFFTTPLNFRVEVMQLGSGSPLHDSLMLHSDSPVIPVHASFKCVDEQEYVSAQSTLRGHGWEVWQKCDSSYGRFSYWGHPDQGSGWLVKPRLNLRDRSAS